METIKHVRILRRTRTSRGAAYPGPKAVALPVGEADRLAAKGDVRVLTERELAECHDREAAYRAELDRQARVAREAREAADRRDKIEPWDSLDRAIDGSRSPHPSRTGVGF